MPIGPPAGNAHQRRERLVFLFALPGSLLHALPLDGGHSTLTADPILRGFCSQATNRGGEPRLHLPAAAVQGQGPPRAAAAQDACQHRLRAPDVAAAGALGCLHAIEPPRWRNHPHSRSLRSRPIANHATINACCNPEIACILAADASTKQIREHVVAGTRRFTGMQIILALNNAAITPFCAISQRRHGSVM